MRSARDMSSSLACASLIAFVPALRSRMLSLSMQAGGFCIPYLCRSGSTPRWGRPHSWVRSRPSPCFEFLLLLVWQGLRCIKNSSYVRSNMVLSGFRWQPSLCPRMRDHPAGVGYRNYFFVFNRAHAAACSQVKVEVMIKTTSVEFSQRIQDL